jgi:hypothetical protein
LQSFTRIISLAPENAFDYKPGPSCFVNPKQDGAQKKLEWMRSRFKEGLVSKVLYLEDPSKSAGFIEYIPGEQAWRAVDAPDCLFIHCIWIYPNEQKGKGYATELLQDCIREAKEQEKTSVAVVTSEGAFMSGKDLFLNNGFEIVDADKPYSLLVYKIKKGVLPKFRDWRAQLAKYQALHIIYSNQCPWVARSIQEFKEVAGKYGLKFTFTELKSARDAQNAPSIYATFNLIYNRRLLSDHYISNRRFENIIKKEILKI